MRQSIERAGEALAGAVGKRGEGRSSGSPAEIGHDRRERRARGDGRLSVRQFVDRDDGRKNRADLRAVLQRLESQLRQQHRQ